MGRVAVITDSVCCLPEELEEQYNIIIVPISVVIEGHVYRDRVDITPQEVYRLLESGKVLPTTTSPSPGDFLQAYRDLQDGTDGIICITICSDISMMYDSALKARKLFLEEVPDIPVTVIDSRTAGGAQGFIALAAARLATTGASLEAVTQEAERMISRVSMFAVLDTLYYLARSGRIPKVAAWAGSMLKIKPILIFSSDGIRLLERARTKSNAIQRLIEIMRERTGRRPVHVMVMHADVPDEAEALKRQIEAEFVCVEIYVSDFAPTMGVQAGPGVLGIAFYTEVESNVE